MPPDASSRPEMGLNFIETSTSVYGPAGDTMTLNSLRVARCTRTFLPPGAPAMSSTAHWPVTVVQLARFCVAKSAVTSGMLSGTFTSAAANAFSDRRVIPMTPSAASDALNNPRRVTFKSCMCLPHFCCVLRLLLQDRVETVEERHAALEQVVVVRRGLRQRPDGQVDAGRLVTRELAVVQIRLVDDLGDELHAPVLEPEPPDQRLERAVLAVVAEVGAQHVERNSLARGVRGVGERERRVGIAEALDEPRRGDAVDVRPRAGHPRAPARRQRRGMAPFGGGGPGFGRAQTLRRRLPERPGALPRRRLQVVDRRDAVELALESVEPGPELRGRSTVRRPVTIELTEDLTTSLHDRLVFGAPRGVKEPGDLVVLHGLDAVDAQQRDLPLERLDLLHQPLKELGRLGGLRQDPPGAAEPDGAHALELSPDADAMPRGRGRERHEQGQPPHGSESNACYYSCQSLHSERRKEALSWRTPRPLGAFPSRTSSGTICGSASSASAVRSRSSVRWSASWSPGRAGSQRRRCEKVSPSASHFPARSPSRSASGSPICAAASGAHGRAAGRSFFRTSSSWRRWPRSTCTSAACRGSPPSSTA